MEKTGIGSDQMTEVWQLIIHENLIGNTYTMQQTCGNN